MLSLNFAFKSFCFNSFILLYKVIFPLSIFIVLYFFTPFLLGFGTDSDFKEILSFLKKSLLIEGPFVIRFIASTENFTSFFDIFAFSLLERL